MPALDDITQDALVAWLGTHEIAKGLGYLARVSELSTDGRSVSRRTPFRSP